VTLKVSAGVGEVDVPDVVGRTEAEAVRILSTAELASRTEFRADDRVEKGVVIIQNPPAGSRALRRSEVVIIVSSGRENETVPDLTGQNEVAAANQLGRLELVAAIEREFSADVPDGVVIATRPGAGASIRKGETVVLVVSRGPEPTPSTTSSTSSTTSTTTAGP
jgi:serine/threonine-protein kinase